MKTIPTYPAGGFAIVSAIFLLIVLTLMAAFIVSVTMHHQAGHVADLRGTQAYQAARAGVEWGLYQHVRNAACDPSSSFSPGGNLAEFTVTVECLPAGAGATNENGMALTVRRIVATACNQPSVVAPAGCPNLAPGNGYVERQLAVVTGR